MEITAKEYTDLDRANDEIKAQRAKFMQVAADLISVQTALDELKEQRNELGAVVANQQIRHGVTLDRLRVAMGVLGDVLALDGFRDLAPDTLYSAIRDTVREWTSDAAA